MTSESKDKCLGCGKQAESEKDMFSCSGCNGEATFCSKECQKIAWPTHRFECLPCWICERRIPGISVHRACGCRKQQGYVHVECVAKLTERDDDGGTVDCQSLFRAITDCKLCQQPFTEDFQDVVFEEWLDQNDSEGILQTILHTDYKGQDKDEVVAYQTALVLCDRLYGEDNWSSDSVFRSHFLLAEALSNAGRFDEALDKFLLVQMKLNEHKIQGWKHLVRKVKENLIGIYVNQRNYDEAIPLLEEAHEKDSFSDDTERILIEQNLTSCYMGIGEWKKARGMADAALKLSIGSDHDLTLKCTDRCAEVVSLSYNSATTRGVKDVPNGIMVEIKGYSTGFFEVSLKRSSLDEEDRQYTYRAFDAPVDQVIMVGDSDVVLHSLKGAKELNGRLGVITDFDSDIGRYKVIVEGLAKTVNVKPQNLLPAYMGCDKQEMMELAERLSAEEEG